MPQNHRNRSWRSMWSTDPVSRTAVHKSGAIVCISSNPSSASGARLAINNLGQVDVSRWSIAKILEQGAKLKSEGAY
ncbi:MAG: hypothetical protein U0989_08090 [Azonexus sp.]|nr:hypothetical protein [Azonexus sp.]